MVIVYLIGGLGNQLFQYAAARRIALTNDEILKIDISWFPKNPYRSYRLHHFNIQENFVTPEELASIPKNGFLNKFYRMLNNKNSFQSEVTIYQETQINFQPEFLDLKGNLWLQGYWQCEKYFKDIEETIRKEFTIKTEPDEINQKMIKQINEVNAISIHIRRTDYLSPNTNYHTCSLDYYQKAIEELCREVKEPCFFVFSDDMQWVKDNLRIPYPTVFVDHNGPEKEYEDLRLMSLCKHHVIANSSFSWWGAWLSPHKNKKVYAPVLWFTKEKFNSEDIVPDSWKRI